MHFDPHTHGLRYAPEYPPHGFSDHLPMAWQALGALGADAARRDRFAAAYLPRLAPLPPGSRDRVATLRAEIRASDPATVVRRRLPSLISGWYKEAYHPLIRLAYGIEFGVAAEVAAALAYFESAGPCERLAALARTAHGRPPQRGPDLLRQAEGWRPALPDAGFGQRAATVLEQPEMAELAVHHDLETASRAALTAFAVTHDFFALHLLTGSHAFRIVRPYLALAEVDAILNLGLLAGYVAIGAPALPTWRPPGGPALEDPSHLLALCRDDEHDVKVAYSAWAQAAHWKAPAYVSAVADYLRQTGDA